MITIVIATFQVPFNQVVEDILTFEDTQIDEAVRAINERSKKW